MSKEFVMGAAWGCIMTDHSLQEQNTFTSPPTVIRAESVLHDRVIKADLLASCIRPLYSQFD